MMMPDRCRLPPPLPAGPSPWRYSARGLLFPGDITTLYHCDSTGDWTDAHPAGEHHFLIALSPPFPHFCDAAVVFW